MDTFRNSDLFGLAPAFGLLLIAALISFSRLFERNPSSIALLLTAVVWLWAQAAISLVSFASEKLFFLNLKYVALALIPPFWAGTSFRFTGLKTELRRMVQVGLLIVALFFIALVLTDAQTHWFFKSLVLAPGARSFVQTPGPFYGIFLVELFGALAVGLLQLVRARRFFSPIDRRRALTIFLAVLIPAAAGFLDALALPIFHGIPLAPGATLVSAGILVFGILKARLLAPIPLAQDVVVHQMSDPVIVIGSSQTVDWMNPSAKEAFALDSFVSGRPLKDLIPQIVELISELRKTGQGNLTWSNKEFRLRATPVQDPKTGLEALVVVFHDITALKAEQTRLEHLVRDRTSLLQETNFVLEKELVRYQETQIRLERLIAEKELLLKEVNHRVKNNLQIILSLINLQARRAPDEPRLLAQLEAMKGRIRSISLVHERMYRTSFGNGLDFREYLEELVHGIGVLYAHGGAELIVNSPSQPVQAGVDFSIDFGLVVNELVTNAYKHGILPYGAGVVSVKLELSAGSLHLYVRDPGTGLLEPEALKKPSLGLNIVQSILKKYGAELKFEHRDGSVVEVIVPWEDSHE